MEGKLFSRKRKYSVNRQKFEIVNGREGNLGRQGTIRIKKKEDVCLTKNEYFKDAYKFFINYTSWKLILICI